MKRLIVVGMWLLVGCAVPFGTVGNPKPTPDVKCRPMELPETETRAIFNDRRMSQSQVATLLFIDTLPDCRTAVGQ